MNSKTIHLAACAVCAAVGAAAAWWFAKKKYERLAQEEIDSVKEVFSKRAHSEQKDTPKTAPKPEKAPEKGKQSTYATIVRNMGYGENTEKKDAPYIIPADEFGDFDDYDTITLNFYADNIVADDDDEIIEDIEDTIGFDSLSRFYEGAGDIDSVYVRNERLKCDYEIFRDLRRYRDIPRPPR